MDTEQSTPHASLMPLCRGHLQQGAGGEECVLCKLERYERVLDRLADAFSTLTLAGVIQLAREARGAR